MNPTPIVRAAKATSNNKQKQISKAKEKQVKERKNSAEQAREMQKKDELKKRWTEKFDEPKSRSWQSTNNRDTR